MQILTEKIKWMLAAVLEAMETGQESADTGASPQSDEREESKELELNTDAHHTMIEPCW